MSSSPRADANIFSLRIVSLDYYMSSPIHGLDVTYSSFQSGNVEEVPVIRIYGSTPAGQKACLHIHKALPYLYIPCPEYAIKSPQEGLKFLHKLSISLEKALKSKGNSATKRQHVHDCRLVRAKKFYGHHTSDDLFVKICLYYPHEVLSTATMLLDGAILNTCFQPYESHIPYLLHFLVDYNLYGMGHIHLSKYNFRSPLPDNHIPPATSFQNNGTKVHENLAVWLSSTVSGDLILLDNKNHFIMRQSCCTLEVDASVNDILNETHKMYTSLSQTRSDIKMVQSLVPIWEEEYERSGTQDTVPPDMSKPAPENVLSVFNEGFEYEKVFGELCAEINKIFPSKNVEIEDVKIDRSVESTIAAGKVSVDELGDSIENKNTSTPFKYLLLENKETMASENLNHSDGFNFTSDKKLATNISNPDQECVDTDALGLLNWLASSQAAADVSTDDELVSEPILSPFLSKKTYKEALKIAHLDYEHASQIECQDILDTVEDFDKDQISLSSDQNCTVSCSSSYAIPQVDGPVDEYTPGIGGDSEVNITSEGKKLTRKRSKHKNNEHLWGTLPFTFNQKWQDNFEPTVSTPCNDQLMIDDNIHTGKRSKSVPLDSARDLMRRKRHLRTNVIKDIEKTQFSSKEHPTYNFEAHGNSSFGNQAMHNTHDVTRGFMKTCNMKLFAQEHTSLDGETAITKKDTDMCTRNLITAIKEHMADQDSENRITELDCLQNKQIQDTKQNAQDVEGNVSGYGRHEPANHDCITSCVLDKRNHTVEYAEMSFNMKPPSRDEVDRFPDNLTERTTYAEKVFRECTGDIPPFYMAKFEEERLNKSLIDENLNLGQQSYLGVPTHFQNDGSILYMLTHATLPPTQESVTQWISEVTRGKNLGDSPDVYHCLKPDISSQEISTVVQTGSQGNRKVLDENNEEGTHIKEQAHKNELYDFSQISGPGHEEKSELTPLSQIGFRDPASHGGGQQLTLISIEVHAESRGDLLPDPKVDAINVICIAIQEDSCHMVEVYVLIRASNDESNRRHIDGIPDCKFSIFDDEYHMFDHLIKLFSSFDPDIIIGWEIQGGSLGFLAERAIQLNISLLKRLSRIPTYETKAVKSDNTETSKLDNNPLIADVIPEYSVIEDEWGRTHASGIHISGRIVLNVWRLMRSELKLNMYTVEAVAEEVLRRKIPSISNKVLSHWFQSGPAKARHKCIQYVNERAKLNLQIMNQLDMINRTSELARVFGIDFFSVLSRGSQYRVESMLLRLAHTQNYLAISAGNQQVASQPAMECLPLVMEPESGFYTDPVVVLDFQSLYPSMIIAYNLCYSTCLGSIYPSKTNVLGVTSYLPDPLFLKDSKQLLVTPNGVMYVPSEVRRGVLPRLLEEILTTRIMVKQAMKKLTPSQQVLQRIFNARQLALKLIANVTYGYTAAGFSGRMPCAELADSIVQCGRRTLETAISYVNHHDTWNAKVIYGDTDSMFVLLKGRSREEAFRIGNEIASAITAMNPYPVTLKMEKVYQPCFLLTKKRYVGYSYESPTQDKPIFDAKGIETVRRDTCPTVAKTLERSIRLMFEHQDISMVKTYLQRQWRRIISGKVSLQDFVFAKEVRLGTYSTRASALPPAAIVAQKAMQNDPRAEPKFGERIPYVVIHGEPGARLVDMVVNPYVLLDINSPYRLNELYYINKQIIPALQRVLGLVGADLNKWFSELPRPIRQTLTKRYPSVSYSGSMLESGNDMRAKSSRIDTYYSSKHCIVCGKMVQASNYLCGSCSKKETLVATVMVGKASKLEREIQHLAAICTHCGGADNIVESGIKCTSLACSVFYERRKVQKELLTVSSFATAKGFYPMCMAEWF